MDWLDQQAVILLLILLGAVVAFWFVINDRDNDVKLSDFFASRGKDGLDHGDPDKLAKMVGTFASTLYVGYTFWSSEINNFWPVAVFAIWLIFVSGISVFSAWARSFVDRRYGSSAAQPAEAPSVQRKVSDVHTDETISKQEKAP